VAQWKYLSFTDCANPHNWRSRFQEVTVEDRDRICPACDTAALGEWDRALRVFVCGTCATTW
jgi:hypothetical protein